MSTKKIESIVDEVNAALEGTAVAPIKATTKKATKPATKRTRGAAKAETPKPAPKRTRKPAAPKAEPVVNNDKDSVTGTFIVAQMPRGNGGVRFHDENERGFSPFYLAQDHWNEIGQPERLRITVKAL